MMNLVYIESSHILIALLQPWHLNIINNITYNFLNLLVEKHQWNIIIDLNGTRIVHVLQRKRVSFI